VTTHPDYASLVDPLFGFAGKRVTAPILMFRTLKDTALARKATKAYDPPGADRPPARIFKSNTGAIDYQPFTLIGPFLIY
jgi:hypothetical protein